MSKTYITAGVLLVGGAILCLVGWLMPSVTAAPRSDPALQLSPRPTLALPTLTPTGVAPPTAEPTTEPESPSGPQPAAPSPTPSSTPTPPLLPSTGGAYSGGWLGWMGGGLALAGLILAFLRRLRETA